ncbi:MAG: hypothetical protein JXB88_01725 [Spirochaetales bacterium]|nr:hypothetical protein [Spirochaetales bacterium]
MNRINRFSLILLILFCVYGCITVGVLKENATLEIQNSTPYVIKHIYAKPVQGNEWGPDLLKNKTILPFGKTLVHFPDGPYKLKAEVLVDNKIFTVNDGLDFSPGKRYIWTISEGAWLDSLSGSGNYGYVNSYGYIDSYEYLDTYEYMDTYGYL